MPLELDRDEGVSRKQGRPHFNLPAMAAAVLAQPRQVDAKAGKRQEMHRDVLAPRLEACASPE
jgi:hypothetical protein